MAAQILGYVLIHVVLSGDAGLAVRLEALRPSLVGNLQALIKK
ncbi:hypothetical protein [Dyella sp.]